MTQETKQQILDDFNDRFYMELESYEDIEIYLGDEASEDILPKERREFFRHWADEMGISIEDRIISAMKDFCEKDFMNRPGFEPDLEYTLADALTVFIADAMPDEDEAKIFEFINSKLN